MTVRSAMVIPALLGLALAACAAPGASGEASAGGSGEVEASRPPLSTVPAASDDGGDPGVPPEGIPAEAWAALIDDLERRLGGAVVDPTVVSAEPVTWTDGSLGCPKPGEMYTQALIDGYQVIVEVAGERYDYRIGSGRDVRLCEGDGQIEGDS